MEAALCLDSGDMGFRLGTLLLFGSVVGIVGSARRPSPRHEDDRTAILANEIPAFPTPASRR